MPRIKQSYLPALAALLIGLWLLPGGKPVLAGEVEVIKTRFEQQGDSWHVSTTLLHADTGWEHYADAWRVVTEQGRVLATRTLYHPHENEQPFTRSLGDVRIPEGISVVYVEAHDKLHGWSPHKLRVNLNKDQGPGYTVHR